MDFAVQQDPGMEGFRQEVSAWLDAHAPMGVRVPLEGALATPEVREWAGRFQRQLADLGWVVPSWPRAYGGGGLSPDHDMIVREELDSRSVPQLYETNRRVAAAILAWGSEQQRQRFLALLLRGDVTAWRPLADTEAVADPESVCTQAVKDGDVYFVSGAQVYFGEPKDPTYLWTLAVTDPDAPAHRRLGAFLIPADLPGITTIHLETVARGGQHSVTLERVPVPVEYRIGDENDGWAVAQSALETEVDADRSVREQQTLVAKLAQYCKETLRGSRPLSQYQEVQERVAEAYINTQVLRLVALRNKWIRSSGQKMTYQGAQYALLAKSMRLRLADTMLETMGPFALVSDREWAPMEGEAEGFQRTSLPGVNPGDSIVVQNLLIAHCLGLQLPEVGPPP